MPGGATTHLGGDEQLVARARDGDRAAVAELCGRWRSALVRFCCRYLQDHDAAEDAAQEVLGKLAIDGCWPEGPLRAWLFRLARNHCLDQQRRRRTGRVGIGTFFSCSYPSPCTGPRTAASRHERNQQLRALVGSLPPMHAEILTLRYFEELSRSEIAEVLGISESLVRSRLFEARRVLTRRIDERSHEAGDGWRDDPREQGKEDG